MDLIDVSFYFWGIGGRVRGNFPVYPDPHRFARRGCAGGTNRAGRRPIGTPIAEFIAPDSVEYAEAVAKHEVEQLDLREDITERRL